MQQRGLYADNTALAVLCYAHLVFWLRESALAYYEEHQNGRLVSRTQNRLRRAYSCTGARVPRQLQRHACFRCAVPDRLVLPVLAVVLGRSLLPLPVGRNALRHLSRRIYTVWHARARVPLRQHEQRCAIAFGAAGLSKSARGEGYSSRQRCARPAHAKQCAREREGRERHVLGPECLHRWRQRRDE